MAYQTRLTPLVRRQIASWGLSDALLVDVHLQLADRLPVASLRRDPSLFEGEGMIFGFNLIDPANRLLIHAFRFQVFYHADEETLIVHRGGHLTAQDLGE